MTRRPRLRSIAPLPVLAAAGAVGATLLGDQALYAVMPSSPERWGLSIALVGVLLSANRLVRLVSNPLAAVAFHRFGARAPFAAAMCGAVVLTAAYGWVSTFWILLLARAAWGVCWSVLRLGGQWAVLDEATDVDRGRLMGTYQSLTALGAFGGVFLGGLLTEAFGHRSTLTLFAVATAIAGLAWFASTRGRPSTTPRLSAGASIAGFGEVLRDRRLLVISVGGLVVGLIHAGLIGASLGFFFRANYGPQVGVAGLAIGVAGFTGLMLGVRDLLMISLAPAAGHLSDRLGRTRSTVGALALAGGSVALLGLAGNLPLVMVAVLASFATLIGALVQLQAAAGDLAPTLKRAAVLSTYATFQDLGAAIGPLLGLSWESLDALRLMFIASGVALALVAVLYARVLSRGREASGVVA
jgi:MFS family permease